MKIAKRAFLEKVNKNGGTDCWEWTAARDNHGYGLFSIMGEMFSAHRVAHELYIGPIPEGLCVLHKCDNPPCVNPKHLWAGTYTDNMRDMAAKGRSGDTYGERNGMAKLIAAQVLSILSEYANGHISQEALGKKYGVANNTISQIVNGKTWRHLERLAKGLSK